MGRGIRGARFVKVVDVHDWNGCGQVEQGLLAVLYAWVERNGRQACRPALRGRCLLAPCLLRVALSAGGTKAIHEAHGCVTGWPPICGCPSEQWTSQSLYLYIHLTCTPPLTRSRASTGG
jgi:hypothetical protein